MYTLTKSTCHFHPRKGMPHTPVLWMVGYVRFSRRRKNKTAVPIRIQDAKWWRCAGSSEALLPHVLAYACSEAYCVSGMHVHASRCSRRNELVGDHHRLHALHPATLEGRRPLATILHGFFPRSSTAEANGASNTPLSLQLHPLGHGR